MTKSILKNTVFSATTLIAMNALVPTAHAQTSNNEDDTPVETGHIDLDEIVVTASPFSRPLGQVIAGVTILEGEDLQERLESSIGETLRNEPGVSSTFFGPGASRPIIRGLGGDRVRVLEDGIGTFDAAQTSPDHAVPVEPALAQKLEVFRGAASLLYGSSAAGGVVNTDTGKIPSSLPEGGFDGAVRYSHSTVNNADEIAVGTNIALGQIVLHGEYFNRDADDYEISGLNGSDQLIDALAAAAAADGEDFDPDERFTDGIVENSDLETDGGSGGLSFIFDRGFIGASFSILNSNYGVPAGILTEEDLEEGEEGEEGEEEEGEEEGIRIDLKQTRYDIKGELELGGVFEKAKLRLGYGDYRHFELEGDEIGTLFENDEFEGRLELVTNPIENFGGEIRGAYGVQFRIRDFAAFGAEAFVPPSDQNQFGIFALHEFRKGNAIVDLALRYESVSNETDTFIDDEDATPFAVDNDFDLFSVSGGVGFNVSENVFIGANGFRTERAPSLEESLSFGPHLATQSFEVGDPTLGEETATGIEGTIRGEFGPFTTVLNGFYTNYDDFIFERETGGILDGLPVFAFVAEDASFRGLEAQIDLDLGSIDAGSIGAVSFAGHGQVDYVRATLSDAIDENVPRIPPLSSLVGLSASNTFFSLRAELDYTSGQDQIAPFELATDDFLFVNAFLTLRPFGKRHNIAFDIRARNLGDSEGRVHASFLKDTTPLPGRDIRFVARAAF